MNVPREEARRGTGGTRLEVALNAGYWALYLLLLATLFTLLRGVAGQSLAGAPAAASASAPALAPALGSIFLSRIGWVALAPNLLAFYVAYLVIFPRFLAPRRWGAWAVATGSTAFGAALFALASLYVAFGGSQPYFNSAVEFTGLFAGLTAIAAIHLGIALVVRGFVEGLRERERREELERRNLTTELALLRSRVDPHFLFNTLNNIDVLISTRPECASIYLKKLSDLLRFVLYESARETIPLRRELDFVEQYIALEAIRSSHPRYVALAVHGQPHDLEIRPMVLVPFVENAFKHTEGERGDGAIRVDIDIAERGLRFRCSNRLATGPATSAGQPPPAGGPGDRPGGLGNDLIRRRLELLYPGRHRLDLDVTDGRFEARLDLDLEPLALPGG
jgi:two-component system LytT family sensor kinase